MVAGDVVMVKGTNKGGQIREISGDGTHALVEISMPTAEVIEVALAALEPVISRSRMRRLSAQRDER